MLNDDFNDFFETDKILCYGIHLIESSFEEHIYIILMHACEIGCPTLSINSKNVLIFCKLIPNNCKFVFRIFKRH